MSLDKLNKANISIAKMKLGNTVFIPTEEVGNAYAGNSIDPDFWSVSQLRAMADYMEQNQQMTIYDDGSGSPVRL